MGRNHWWVKPKKRRRCFEKEKMNGRRNPNPKKNQKIFYLYYKRTKRG